MGGTDCTMVCWPARLDGGTSRSRRDKGQADHARVCSLILRSKEQVGLTPVCRGLGQRMEKRASLFKQSSPLIFHILGFYFKAAEVSEITEEGW